MATLDVSVGQKAFVQDHRVRNGRSIPEVLEKAPDIDYLFTYHVAYKSI